MGASGRADENPLLAEWSGPYGGVPAFDPMELPALRPALERGMALQLEEIGAIARSAEPPTFRNTVIALERSGRDLQRVVPFWGVWRANRSTPAFREVEGEMVPRLAAFRTSIIQNRALFERLEAVWEGDELPSLRPDQQRLVWLLYDMFSRGGARLAGADRERFAAIEERLAELQTRFANNVLADEERYVHYLSADRLGGLPQSFVRAAAAAAAARGRPGEHAVLNTRSSVEPFLTFSNERELREIVWRTYYARGDNGDEHDNKPLIAEILRLRHERARMLGFASFAEWRLANRMAKTPGPAIELMEAVWRPARQRAEQEVRDMQALADEEGAGITIEAWDYRYYAEKVRRARYALDSDELKAYLQLDRLRDAMFFVAEEVFGFVFTPVAEGTVPVFHEDVRVWEVTRAESGACIGLWYLDPYAREGKRSGAWATAYRGHDTLDGERPVLASNNSNFMEGGAGEPALISWDDAETLFHEFGHALHYLSSTVDYPTLNGGTPDFMELHSQLLERWLLTDEVIFRFLVHHETGEPMPRALVDRVREAAKFNQGFQTTEYLASALVDMRYHTTEPAEIDPATFEQRTLDELGMPREIVMRHRGPHFLHIFSSESYAAGYYSYLWADVLTSDVAEAFERAPGGFYDKPLAKRVLDELFAVRNAVDPAEAYRAFRGRDADVGALLRDRGFAEAAASEPQE